MSIDDREFTQHYYRASYLFARFTVPYMRNIYREFEGDMVLTLVLGEIATRNVGQFFEQPAGPLPETVLNDLAEQRRLLRPCNANSVSEATGIPRETVRRKVNALIERGWVAQDEKGHLFVTQKSAERFERFMFDTLESLLPAAQALARMLAPGAAARHDED
ncbi:hypothetical protein B9N43_11155 [Denitratisoma sp. DHT3]|uniref:helix-turn-helix domain-containing protein n=1 Tax=Denitratisoma sp. DHT3 TaxID=1981880 RepID=UPI001198AC1E|nr:helix-turn-helix domain-containing protein [Denitratisoma sp. DHT3]QDX81759.1 hypothetical protein B9N43_11155 [Denitratisoma sp. DHT3]